MVECKACIFFELTKNKKADAKFDGTCHRYPPGLYDYDNNGNDIDMDDWCGEWKEKE
jgi:hypothetical protein